MGRLVLTHSTYIEGLVNVLKRISDEEKISTITPGVIKRVRGKCEGLRIKVSVKIRYGYKLIARKGNMSQEVFIMTILKEQEINELILKSILSN